MVHASAGIPRGFHALRRLGFAGLLAATGCQESKRPIVPSRDLADPAIGVRAEAVQEVARTRRTENVPELIELLDDEDPGVRLMAGATLRDLTGRDTGYDASAPRRVRRAQVLEWRAWWRSQGGAPAGAGP